MVTKAAPTKEVKTPRQRFRDVAPKRFANARKAIAAIGGMGARTYQFSPAEAERIAEPLIADLTDAVKRIRAYAASGGKVEAPAENPLVFDDDSAVEK